VRQSRKRHLHFDRNVDEASRFGGTSKFERLNGVGERRPSNINAGLRFNSLTIQAAFDRFEQATDDL
jgi:hypothetical protein